MHGETRNWTVFGPRRIKGCIKAQKRKASVAAGGAWPETGSNIRVKG